jgi:hypothetical protein
MNDETRRYEEAFEDIVQSIKQKRLNYYKDYDIEPPSKERALSFLH